MFLGQEVWFCMHLRCNPCRLVRNRLSLRSADRQAGSSPETALDGAVPPSQPPRPSQGQHRTPRVRSCGRTPTPRGCTGKPGGRRGSCSPALQQACPGEQSPLHGVTRHARKHKFLRLTVAGTQGGTFLHLHCKYTFLIHHSK